MGENETASKRPDTFIVIPLTLMDLKNHKSKPTRKKLQNKNG